jgi:hypothetical protein
VTKSRSIITPIVALLAVFVLFAAACSGDDADDGAQPVVSDEPVVADEPVVEEEAIEEEPMAEEEPMVEEEKRPWKKSPWKTSPWKTPNP